MPTCRRDPTRRGCSRAVWRRSVEKILEEAAEVVDAAGQVQPGRAAANRSIHEAADLLYHLFVMLGYHADSAAGGGGRTGAAIRHLGT